MSPGGSGTRSGSVFEAVVKPALEQNGYTVGSQQIIGIGIGGGRHRLDHYAVSPSGEKILVSVKWQEVHGTTDEKIPFEVLKLLDVLDQNQDYSRACIVLGGDGMRKHLETYYTDGSLSRWISAMQDRVRCMTLNQFIKACNRRLL